MTRDLHSFARQVGVAVDHDALELRAYVTGLEWARPETWPAGAVSTSLGRRTATEAAMVIEMGFGEDHGATLRIPFGCFGDLEREEISLPFGFSQASPFPLHIERSGVIGRSDFRYIFRFLLGGRPVPLERTGPYLYRAVTKEWFHLDGNQFALVEAMDRFNTLPAEARHPQASWLAFADVKRLSSEVNATLDNWLQSNDVVVPSSIGLDFYEEPDGSLSFVPTSPSLDAAEFRTVFQRSAEAQGFYTIQRSGTERVRIVLSDRQRTVLSRMKRVQRVRGEQRAAVERDPLQVFDGIAGDVELPDSYSDRVLGIGSFVYQPVPKLSDENSRIADLWGDAPGPDAANTQQGEAPRENEEREKLEKKTLLIDTHEESVGERYLQQAEQARGSAASWQFQSPDALAPTCTLDIYQQAGVGWLQRCSRIAGRTGVLLADDMGLGKTLQLLTFLAWVIESGVFPELSKSRPPYRPILIAAPLTLLESRTWEGEMERFFREKGNVFLPLLSLYGPMLRAYRRPDAGGQEGIVGRPVLDLDRIRQHRVVITNYEALRDYEFSFAYHPDGQSLWSVVVSDEAQEFKTPNSRISHAMKKMQPPFRIACTGTPVENRLLDLWNIFDALQPGLLGSAHHFAAHYEQAADGAAMAGLKRTLLYQQPHAFMLRRTKDEVLSLPAKHIHRIQCAMSVEEREEHQRLAVGLGAAGQQRQRLNLLHDFVRLYQHPALLRSPGDEIPAEELTRSSSKLSQTIAVLRDIESKGEKVLIFARHKDVQRMLARVLGEAFRTPVHILNGDTPTTAGARGGAALTRRGLLEEFKHKSGFNVIVLSPFVAGVGLTVTEANHVIHYGRWWNPAVESQATDRVYRRGQTKPVHVYLPILSDPSGQIRETFDQALDQLMTRKEHLASSTLAKEGFQAAAGSEESAGAELIQALSMS